MRVNIVFVPLEFRRNSSGWIFNALSTFSFRFRVFRIDVIPIGRKLLNSFFVILKKMKDYNIDIAERNGAERLVFWKIWRMAHGPLDGVIVVKRCSGIPFSKQAA